MREGVSQREINEFRRDSTEYLSDESDIYRLKPIGTGDDYRPKGRQRWPDDYAVHIESTPTGVRPAQRRREENLQAGQVRARGDWLIHFPPNIDVAAEDIVKVASDTRSVGLRDRVFNVIGLLSGSDEITRIAEASEIR